MAEAAICCPVFCRALCLFRLAIGGYACIISLNQENAMNTPTDSTTLRLGSKHCTLFYASRGTTIIATQGNILIATAAACVAGIPLASRAFITEGECHVLQQGGWMRLQASGAGSAACLVLAPAGNRLVALWQRWLRRALQPAPLRS
jgi:hypothetical protein